MSVYVGIDVHRKRSQVAVVSEDGTVELNKNVVNGSEPMLRLIGDLPSGTPVAFEAAFGWGWLVQLLEDYGFEPHMVHPLRCKAIASARLKNDKVDAAILAQLLRADLLPEAWIAPPKVRQLRALLRHRSLEWLGRNANLVGKPPPNRSSPGGHSGGSSPSNRLAADSSVSSSTCTYRAVVCRSAWPSRCITAFGFSPASISHEACVCRSW
jgi:Transposase